MNRIGWTLVAILVALIFILQVAIIYIKVALPNVGEAPIMTVQKTPERLQRGKYLANHVAVCIDCHSTRDWRKYAAPLIAGTEGMGGEAFTREMGFPGTFYAPNITPDGLLDYSDGELLRLITTGVRPDNTPIFPVMPYHNYGKLDQEDIYSMIAYIRSLTTIRNEVPESKADFPMSVLMNTMPQKAALTPAPPQWDTVAYGKYLVTMAACYDCHTPFEKGSYIEGMDFAGGREFNFPNGSVNRSANITPDKETGLGWTTRAQFIAKFKQFNDSSYTPRNIGLDEANTVMPWGMYAGMTESDLASIFAYLRTLKPITNKVNHFERAGK